MFAVVTGGSGSGKSAYAEKLVLEQGEAKRYYIATMRPWDEECRKKIERHRKIRARKQFETIECYEDLHLISVEPGSVVLLECMSNLASNEFYRAKITETEITETEITEMETPKMEISEMETVKTGIFREIGSYSDLKQHILDGIQSIIKQADTLIVVTNEVFSDGCIYAEDTEDYRKLLGEINQAMAGMADFVTEIVYGIPVKIKER